MQARPYLRLWAIVAAAMVLSLLVTGAGRPPATLVAAPDGIVDAGKLTIETNQKLDQVNANLRELNGKMQELLELLKSGQVQVTVKAPAAARPAGAGGSTGSDAGQ